MRLGNHLRLLRKAGLALLPVSLSLPTLHWLRIIKSHRGGIFGQATGL